MGLLVGAVEAHQQLQIMLWHNVDANPIWVRWTKVSALCHEVRIQSRFLDGSHVENQMIAGTALCLSGHGIELCKVGFRQFTPKCKQGNVSVGTDLHVKHQRKCTRQVTQGCGIDRTTCRAGLSSRWP